LSSRILVDEIYGKTANTSALAIDSNGVVTRPVIPAWRVGRTANQSVGQGSSSVDVEFDRTTDQNCFLQGGCTISSGVITVPVAGLYQINANVRLNLVSANYIEFYMVINDVATGTSTFSYFLNGAPSSSYDSGAVSSVFSLSANDNVRIKVYAGGDTSHTISSYSTFSGVLIG